MRPGPRNLITDVPGFLVGNAEDHHVKTGATVLIGQTPFVASCHVMGGAPGSRETDLLAPESTVQEVDALVLSGGSAFGLDAAAGVADALRASGRGYPVWGTRIPIVPGAIIFDVNRGGATNWDIPPWRALGQAAFKACAPDFAIGTAGSGTGATTANLKGGLGSASYQLDDGVTVGALVVANPIGQVTVGDGPDFLAAAFEQDAEFGGRAPVAIPPDPPGTKVEARAATVIGIVATDLALTKTQAKRLAVMAHDGIARAVQPSHTPFDGDLIFAASSGRVPHDAPDLALIRVGHAAAQCMARAIARAVFAATPAPTDPRPTWHERFGGTSDRDA